jgi:hypothetical protein
MLRIVVSSRITVREKGVGVGLMRGIGEIEMIEGDMVEIKGKVGISIGMVGTIEMPKTLKKQMEKTRKMMT